MSLIQKLLTAVLPVSWAESLRAESQTWRIRCCGCDASRSVWDAGGVRWKATSVGKRIVQYCGTCRGLRTAAIERIAPADR